MRSPGTRTAFALYDIIITSLTMMIDVNGRAIPLARDRSTGLGKYRVGLMGSLTRTADEYNGAAFDNLLSLSMQALHVPLLALSFANCKNVKVINDSDQQKVVLSRKQAKRMTKPNADPLDAPVKWHVLEIQPMTKVIDRAAESSEATPGKTGIRRGLHIARGHFKDYQEGKGLYGKHHGLYWWNQISRGDASKGKIVKDYDVKAS